ncbi:MAG: CDP-alcohol phosphatidyltransferase family protein, partial [Clostridia bacterium]|nr:CDP-alcohol phosphatidyltransferase family protein [Clostridia bacterium]
MIGFYDYTLVLTLLSLVSSVFGMTQAIDGRFKISILCLAFSGLCDAFDGEVARTTRNRTDDERSFGVQLDSICDVVAFGALPAVICYLLGVRGYIGCIAISFYCICSVIRLSYYNVMEMNRQMMEEPTVKVYYGLPITSITIILPAVFLLELVVSEEVFPVILIAMLF